MIPSRVFFQDFAETKLTVISPLIVLFPILPSLNFATQDPESFVRFASESVAVAATLPWLTMIGIEMTVLVSNLSLSEVPSSGSLLAAELFFVNGSKARCVRSSPSGIPKGMVVKSLIL